MLFSINTLATLLDSRSAVLVLLALFSVAFLALGMMLGRTLAMKRMGAEGGHGRRSQEGGREATDELYVGNLPYEVDDKELKKAFQKFGKVVSARVIANKSSGKSKGFGFVAMETGSQCEAAIKGLHGKDLRGRKLIVNRAK